MGDVVAFVNLVFLAAGGVSRPPGSASRLARWMKAQRPTGMVPRRAAGVDEDRW